MFEDTLKVTSLSRPMKTLKQEVMTLAEAFWVPIIVDPRDTREFCSFTRSIRDGRNGASVITIFGTDGSVSRDGELLRGTDTISSSRFLLILGGSKVPKEVWRELEGVPFAMAPTVIITVANQNKYRGMLQQMSPECRKHFRTPLTWPTLDQRKADHVDIVEAVWNSIQKESGPKLAREAKNWFLDHMDQFEYVDDIWVTLSKGYKFALEVGSDTLHSIHLKVDRKDVRKKVRTETRRSLTPTPTPAAQAPTG